MNVPSLARGESCRRSRSRLAPVAGLGMLLGFLSCLSSAVAQERREEGVIPTAAMSHEQGFCYTASLKAACKPDTPAGQVSHLRLLENDLELGPARAMHQHIRDSGGGAFSHWSAREDGQGECLYFSASDNTDPQTNGRTYRWVVVWDKAGKPVASRFGSLEPQPCRLHAVPDAPPTRDPHTMLLADFDAPDNSDARYARVQATEVGQGSKPDAPGRFGGGVAVEGAAGCVMYPGLDNYNPLTGTVEFWAQSCARGGVWADGKEHWFLVLYPERAGAGARYGMAPAFLALRKTADNELELRVTGQSIPHYAAAVGLRGEGARSLRLPVGRLAPDAWHHLVVSWDLRGSGRAWVIADGSGVTADLRLPSRRPAPNPGTLIVFGGFWGLPGDGVLTSECNLDGLRIQDCPVSARLVGAPAGAVVPLDESRLLQEMDLSRAMLDRLIALQQHGGWAAGYHWPTYTPTGWSLVGRGVDFWFSHTAFAAGALVRGWRIWGDDRYLDAAIETADMCCKTQMANGSWSYHYTYSRGEFEPWGTGAYVAQAMQGNQIRLLCLMYRLLGYERYGSAIRKAGDWIASIQFPSGAWGWETYPLGHQGPYGHPALNDAVTPQAMWDLFVIWCATGERKYLDCALKGAQWIVDVQAKAPTFGWADQYSEKNEFIWMRNFEPPAVSMQAISSATWGLCLAYDLTGDPEYLEPLRKVLTWMDTVPEVQRGWLWYDPKASVPVVAYYHEMLPVTDPKAIREIIPRLDAHYGTKYPWQADRIRRELDLRKSGPVYPDWRGVRSRAEFARAPAPAEFAERFAADRAKGAREQLAAWAAGKPLPGLVGGSVEYGRTFQIGSAINHCETLLTDIESALAALGDLPPESIPRYGRGGASNWVYLDPARDFYATPPAR